MTRKDWQLVLLTDLTHIDVSEEDDAHWEESVNTGDEISVQTRRQVKTVTGRVTGYLRDEGAGRLYLKCRMQDEGNVEQR